jgi:AcrR family transcriptional regulator
MRAPARRRDAEQTRRALLEAAGALFDERGYDRATTREIGERAGVDPALIARYFGSKEALYLAVLADEERLARREPVAADLRVVAERLLRRWDTAGGAPVRRALADPEPPSARERAQVRRILRPGVLDPARAAMAGDAGDAELRAQLLLALLVGVSVTRSNGTLPALAQASRAELLRQLEPLLDALEDGAPAPGRSASSSSST